MANPLSHFQPGAYQDLLALKQEKVCELFSGFDLPKPALYASPAEHFRMRAEFRIWHEGDDSFYAVFDQSDPRAPIRVEGFPIACKAIDKLMQPLLGAIKQRPSLRNRLFQVEFLSSRTGDTLVSLIYHKKLDEEWHAQAKVLEANFGIAIVGRSRKQKIVVSKDYVRETIRVNGRDYHYLQPENSFTQPNATINSEMINWACQQAGDNNSDLLELYCGNGNFTLPLASCFQQVLATEIAKTSIRAAQQNCVDNQVDNIHIVRLSSEETVSALRRDRPFRRLADIDLDSFNFSTLLVDPPRSGLDPATEELASQFERIIYISCNPHTMVENLRNICQSHRISKFAIFDQFPYTEHCECAMLLEKK